MFLEIKFQNQLTLVYSAEMTRWSYFDMLHHMPLRDISCDVSWHFKWLVMCRNLSRDATFNMFFEVSSNRPWQCNKSHPPRSNHLEMAAILSFTGWVAYSRLLTPWTPQTVVSLKFHPDPPCPTLLHPASGPPLKRPCGVTLLINSKHY
jgi:hypothetical protein